MTDRDVVRRGYDELARTYAEERSDDDEDPERLREFFGDLREEGHGEPPLTVLDAGCGRGTPGVERVVDGTVVGLDVSREQLRLGRSDRDRTAFLQGDMVRLPFVSDRFDAVVAAFSLIHVPLDHHPTVLSEFARVLRPGGRLLLTEGTSEWSGSNEDWLDAGVEMQWSIAGPDRTREQVQDAGFQIVEEYSLVDDLAEDDASMHYFVAELPAGEE